MDKRTDERRNEVMMGFIEVLGRLMDLARPLASGRMPADKVAALLHDLDRTVQKAAK